MILLLDFETRSAADLRRTGVRKYADHPSTGIWLLSYAFDDEPAQTWWATGPDATPFPQRIQDHIRAGGALWAHNAEFERVMWTVLQRQRPEDDIATPRLDQWYDTAAEAAAMALPRNLANAAVALMLSEQKDVAGQRTMLQLSRPRSISPAGRVTWWGDPEKLARLASYGLQDVATERALYTATRRLGVRERAIYLLDQVVNDRGVMFDMPLVRAMKGIAEHEIELQNEIIEEATGGAVERTTQVARLQAWLTERGTPTDSVQKAQVRNLLMRDDLPDDVAAALAARQEAAKYSLKKLGAILDAAQDDDRVRGLLLYHAASTGRWAARQVQPHNFPRPEIKQDEIERYIPTVFDGTFLETVKRDGRSPLAVLSSMLRATLVAAPGHDLMVADYSAIEARGTAWVAGQTDLVQMFAHGQPVYMEMAAQIYNRPVSAIEKGTLEYVIGKATILGCGYGMGAEKFCRMLAEQGITAEEKFCQRVVELYRIRFSRIPETWKELDKAAKKAVARPGSTHRVGPVQITQRGAYLWLILPSGRPLAYFQPRVVERPKPWGTTGLVIEVMHVNQITRKWEPTILYGGLLMENIVQAVSRDLMAEGMLAVEGAGYPVILTVHDEVMSEVPEGFGDLREFETLLTRGAAWASGLPLAVEGWRGKRWRK